MCKLFGHVRKKVLDELAAEDIIDNDNYVDYCYKGLGWAVGLPSISDSNIYQIHEYTNTFFKHAVLCGDDLWVDPKYDTGEYMIFDSNKSAKEYIRSIYKRMMNKVIELKNKETMKVIDSLA